MSRRSNLVVPEYNPNEGVRPEQVLHFNIKWKKNDYQLDRSDYRQMEYDNDGNFTNRYITVTHGTPQQHTWQLDNIDGNVHDFINTNVNYYRNLFRLMNRIITRGMGWIESKILDELKGDHVVRETILKRKYEMLAIQNFLIDSSVTDYEITPLFDDDQHLRQQGDEIPTTTNPQREFIQANPLRDPIAIAQPYREGMLQDAEHLTNPAHIYSPVNAPRMTTRVFPIPESKANDPYGRPTYGGKRKKKKTKKQRGAGGMCSRPRSVQPEQNYAYSHHNNTQVVPLDFVSPHHYTTFRTIWKKGRKPSNEYMENDYHGNRVHDWITVIVNPPYFEDSDFAFAGTTDANVLYDIEDEIRHYSSLLRRSFLGNVYDYITRKDLSIYDIKLKIYQLLAIKYHIRYNPIQEARAEILRPAEQASASINGGKRKKMKGGGGMFSRQDNSTIYNSEGHPIVSPDDIIYIKTSWIRGEPKYQSVTISHDYLDGNFADSYVDVKLSNYWNYNWKFTPTNGDINPEITRTLKYYFNLLRTSITRGVALDEINNIPISTWQIKLKIYQLHAIRKYFNTNNATAEIIGGKRKRKTKRRKSKHNKTKKK